MEPLSPTSRQTARLRLDVPRRSLQVSWFNHLASLGGNAPGRSSSWPGRSTRCGVGAWPTSPGGDRSVADLHGPVNQAEQFGALGDVQPVALGNQSQPMSPVGIVPAEPGSAHVIVDRNAHARKAGEIEQRTAGGSEIEVDQRGCLSVSKDDAPDGLDLAQAENALRRAVGPVLERLNPGSRSISDPSGLSGTTVLEPIARMQRIDG